MQDLGHGVTLGIMDMLHQENGLGGGYPGDSGHVTLSAGTETSVTESGYWLILETVDM